MKEKNVSNKELLHLLNNCIEHECADCPVSSKGRSCIDELLSMARDRITELESTSAEKT